MSDIYGNKILSGRGFSITLGKRGDLFEMRGIQRRKQDDKKKISEDEYIEN